MAKPQKAIKSKPPPNKRLKPRSGVIQPAHQRNGLTGQPELSEELIRVISSGGTADQIAHLSDPRLHTAQRQALRLRLAKTRVIGISSNW